MMVSASLAEICIVLTHQMGSVSSTLPILQSPTALKIVQSLSAADQSALLPGRCVVCL